MRFEEYRRGKLIHLITLKYRQDEKNNWIPASWTNASYYGADTLRSSTTMNVKEFQLGEPLSSELFEIPTPVGTWVRKYDTDETYILRNGGEKRKILPGEFNGENYEQLLNSESPTKKTRSLTFTILGAAVLILVLIALYRYWKHDRVVPPPG